MELCLDIICDHLPKSLKLQRFGPVNSNLTLNFPMLYEADLELEKDRLYVARAGTLPRIPPKKGLTVVCIDQCPPQEWVEKGCQILLISNGSSLFFVFNEICKIFDKFKKWDISLRNELEEEDNFDIRKIINIGVSILENPVSVANGCMLHIFRTEIIKNEGNTKINIVVSDTCQDDCMDGFEKIKDACRLERVIKEPYMSSVVVEGNKYYCNNLYPFGSFAGCIAIRDSHRPFRESDFSLADHFFTYFQKAYAKYLRRKPQLELVGSSALKNLLDGMPLSIEEQEELTLEESECWTCFKLNSLRKTNPMPMDYMYTTLNTLIPGSIYAVIYDNGLSGLIKLHDDKNGAPINTLTLFEDCLKKMGYIAGLSNQFFDVSHIGIYMKQADYAVEIGSSMEGNAHLFRFEAYILQYMLTRYNGAFSAEYLFAMGLLSLIEHDKSSNADYVRTLDIYLNNEMSITKTAEELFLHRSSLLSRLKRIRKLLDMDLEDPDVRLYLRVCLYLLKNK